MKTESEEEKQERVKRLRSTIEIIKEGYGGILADGKVVDRREYPDAIPMQKNGLLGVPEPKDVKKEKTLEVRICPNTLYCEDINNWRISGEIENRESFTVKENEKYSAKRSGNKFVLISKL